MSIVNRILGGLLVMLGMVGLSACDGGKDGEAGTTRPTVGFVTNGVASFWTIAEAGARAAGEELDVQVEVRMPAKDGAVGNQKRMIEELLAMQVDGMAVSPIDPENQLDILNEAAKRTKLITHDSDAPASERLVFIGVENYAAGRICGQLVKEAIPDGGELMIFVGRIEQLNARQRRQGVIDELLGRSHDATRFDAPDVGVLEGNGYKILDTRTDAFDQANAKAQAEDALVKYPSLACMVGLFAYNPPMIIEALSGAGKLGEIKVVGFDEDNATLQGIVDGQVFGTVVQNPYEYGFKSVKILAALARGTQPDFPESGFIDVPARKIVKSNVESFWEELKNRLGSAPAPQPK